MFQTKLVEKIKTHLKFNNFFSSENRAVYEKILKNVVERGRPHDNIIWRMHFVMF
jgi:replicative DNA helicase